MIANRLTPLALFVIILPALLTTAQTREMLAHFDYDKKAPIGLKELAVEQRGSVSIHDITYVSPKGGLVPAYLVVPKGKGPFAAVIWGHWYWSNSKMRNRTQFLDEAVALASSGVVSLLTDGPIARPGHVPARDFLSDKNITDRVQQVIDMRRGVDLLLARKDVDPKRIAFVGHSYNATTGAFLSGIERRIRSFVLMAGATSVEVTLNTPEVKAFRQELGAAKFDAFMKKYEWADQGKYVSHAAPAMVFLQSATQEKFITPERAKLYAAVVSEPKRFKLYDAPHALNAEARRDRLAFLAKRLKLRRLSPAVIAAIPDLDQPPSPN